MPYIERTNPAPHRTWAQYFNELSHPEVYGFYGKKGNSFQRGVTYLLGGLGTMYSGVSPKAVPNDRNLYNNDYQHNNWHISGMYLAELPFRSYGAPWARHTISFATLTPEDYATLSDEEKKSWREWDPRITRPESKEPSIFYRIFSATPDSNNDLVPDGDESYWPIAHYLFDHQGNDNVFNDAVQGKQVWVWNKDTGKREKQWVYNSHQCLPPTNIFQLKLNKSEENIPIAKRIHMAMDDGAKYVRQQPAKYEQYLNNCHKNTTGAVSNNRHVAPGKFSSGGLCGGTAVTGQEPRWNLVSNFKAQQPDDIESVMPPSDKMSIRSKVKPKKKK